MPPPVIWLINSFYYFADSLVVVWGEFEKILGGNFKTLVVVGGLKINRKRGQLTVFCALLQIKDLSNFFTVTSPEKLNFAILIVFLCVSISFC